jgi:peptidoglycan hydrolase-like protein with peptidoglycan-binding domain
MHKLIFSGLIALLSVALIQPCFAGRRSTSIDGTYYPGAGAYDSAGTKELVRKVQLALEEDGYYVGSHSGNFGFETRVAVRRYRRDHGLPIIGKIDDALLQSLGFR